MLNVRTKLAGGALALGLLAASFQDALAADRYLVDPTHADIGFRAGHVGIAETYGRFNDISGAVVIDQDQPENSSVELVIESASVDTNLEARDKHLRSPDFLDAEAHPQITFKSTEVRKTGDDTVEVVGDFTLRGITKTITVPMTVKMIEAHPFMPGNPAAAGVTGAIVIKRSDYGSTYGIPAVSDEIEIDFSLELIEDQG